MNIGKPVALSSAEQATICSLLLFGPLCLASMTSSAMALDLQLIQQTPYVAPGIAPILSRDGSTIVFNTSANVMAAWKNGTVTSFDSDDVITGMSADGTTFFGYELGGDPYQTAIVIDANGKRRLPFGQISAMSADGNVIVFSDGYPFIMIGNTTPTLLPGRDWGSADSVSADGTLVGGAVGSDGGFVGPVLWKIANGVASNPTYLATPLQRPGYATVTAFSADKSTLIGYEQVGSGGITRGVRWTIDGLGNPVGAPIGLSPGPNDQSMPMAVSSDGSVVAGNYNPASNLSKTHVFRWTSATGSVDIGSIAAGATDTATAMSDNGTTIVGIESYVGQLSLGFVWTPDIGMTSVATRLASQNIDSSAYRLISADGVSADGTIVMGRATAAGASDANGATLYLAHLTPPSAGSGDGVGNTGTDFQSLAALPYAGVAPMLSRDGSTIVFNSSAYMPSVWRNDTVTTFDSDTTIKAMSADGTTLVGYDDRGGSNREAFVITGGVKTALAYPSIYYPYAEANGISADGTVVVGDAITGVDGSKHAVMWVNGVPSAQLYDSGWSTAKLVSPDGKLIAGLNNNDSVTLAAVWQIDGSGGPYYAQNLALPISNPIQSDVTAMSFDGSTIVGAEQASIGGGPRWRAIRWDVDDLTHPVDLSINADDQSKPVALSTDGSVVVGNYSTAADFVSANNCDCGPPKTHVFRWTSATGSVDIGSLGLGASDAASAISGDGTIVVGTESNIPHQLPLAFAWTTTTGMTSMASWLSAADVDTSAYRLISADGISADGTIVMGEATAAGATDNTGATLYLARLNGTHSGTGGSGGTGSGSGGSDGSSPPAGGAFITGDIIDRSFASLGAPPAGNSDHLGAQFDDAGQFGPPRTGGPSAFASGGFDTDPAKSGSLGVTAPLGNDFELGATVDAGKLTADLSYGGVSDFWAGSASAFLARNSNSGAQLFVGVGGDLFTGTITRGYLNGATQVSSVGDTGGYGLAANGQLGWRFGDGSDGASLMPFVSATYAHTHIRGYSERGGPFPATLDAIDSSSTVVRTGVEARLANGAGFAVSARLAAVHSVVATGPVTGALAGLLALNGQASTSATDWLETGAGLNIPMGPSTDASLGVLARFPVHGTRSFAGQAGVRVSF